MKLVKRWAFFDKSYKIPQIKKDLKKYPKFLDWVLSTDKNDILNYRSNTSEIGKFYSLN